MSKMYFHFVEIVFFQKIWKFSKILNSLKSFEFFGKKSILIENKRQERRVRVWSIRGSWGCAGGPHPGSMSRRKVHTSQLEPVSTAACVSISLNSRRKLRDGKTHDIFPSDFNERTQVIKLKVDACTVVLEMVLATDGGRYTTFTF